MSMRTDAGFTSGSSGDSRTAWTTQDRKYFEHQLSEKEQVNWGYLALIAFLVVAIAAFLWFELKPLIE